MLIEGYAVVEKALMYFFVLGEKVLSYTQTKIQTTSITTRKEGFDDWAN
jgi:hypothetical protein